MVLTNYLNFSQCQFSCRFVYADDEVKVISSGFVFSTDKCIFPKTIVLMVKEKLMTKGNVLLLRKQCQVVFFVIVINLYIFLIFHIQKTP